MGQARRRGTFEQRKALAIQRKQERLKAIENAKQLRYLQECEAYSVMTEDQIILSEDRHARIIKAKMKSQLDWATLYGMIYGMGWNSFSDMYR